MWYPDFFLSLHEGIELIAIELLLNVHWTSAVDSKHVE